MSKIRTVLEQSLELCESMSLEDQLRYPQAQKLIPLLRDLLEQEEECAHVFVKDQNSEIATCSACGLKDSDIDPKEQGTWIASMKNGKMLVESTDYTHDVTMHIMGDFITSNQMREYGKMIANRLNTFTKD